MIRPERFVTRLRSRPIRRTSTPAVIVGHVVDVAADGEIRVDFDGNASGPLPARTLVGAEARPTAGAAVLIVFEDGDPTRPIILGCVRERLAEAVTTAIATASPEQSVALRTRSLVVEAGQQIVLRCGEASITLSADGTVVVRGTRVVSRASGTNRIRGAAVRIN